MKLKQFLQPADSYFSTPKAARRLLRLFAQLLVLGTIVGAVISITSIFNSEISRRQGFMSDAIANARVFFTQRESLLKWLVLSAVNDPQAPAGHEAADHASGWGVRLTGPMNDYFKDNRLNLLYVPEEKDKGGEYLSKALPFITPISLDVLRKLRALDDQAPGAARELWLSDQSAFPPRLYLFGRVDSAQAESGWIGLEMDAADVSSSLHDDRAGQFMMLTPHGDVMMSSAPSDQSAPGSPMLKIGEDFGLFGVGAVPDQLVMEKKLGYSDWKLSYTLELYSLLKVLWWPLCISLVLVFLTALLVYKLVHRIERRLITPATQRIDALIESEAFCRAVIQTAPVALCVLRRVDGTVVLENRLSEQWLGECSGRERLCHHWIDQAFDEEASNLTDAFEAGNGRHLYVSFAPTRYNGEDVLFCAFSDISSHKQVEAALAMAKQTSDTANEAKTLFLATMSHEIRTPLYGVLGTLELMEKTELRPQQKAYMHAIGNSSAALLNLVCDVLDVSKIEAGQLALEVSEFSPLELVRDVVQNYTGAARGKGILLYSFIDPDMPSVLHGDVTRIRQILNNLLNNAVKFTESGQIVLRAKLCVAEGDVLEVQWQVSDTGPGISQENQAFLFEPFYQAGCNTNVVAGTGLGLSICQRLAALMEGRVRVVSTLGLGSSFTLSVPLENLLPADDILLAPVPLQGLVYVCSPSLAMADYIADWLRKWGARVQTGWPANTGGAENAVLVEVHPAEWRPIYPAWTGPRVLISLEEREDDSAVQLNDLNAIRDAVRKAQGRKAIVDEVVVSDVVERLNLKILVAEDNQVNQSILKDQLQTLGCEVALASDGTQALTLWRGEHFDVVLTDINMPNMNGYELARQLRSIGCTGPIIGATANAMRDEGERCFGAGMQQLLVKPFGLAALSNCLQQYKRTSTRGL
ncbi:response regulator [Pseudomonas sp. NPDC088885]|uniref:response regulator n=1 Tax=Pseudomonas sp. NPDC088885 TaxID=3364457 RepID=UPI003822C084